jgi:hypothetical protein
MLVGKSNGFESLHNIKALTTNEELMTTINAVEEQQNSDENLSS